MCGSNVILYAPPLKYTFARFLFRCSPRAPSAGGGATWSPQQKKKKKIPVNSWLVKCKKWRHGGRGGRTENGEELMITSYMQIHYVIVVFFFFFNWNLSSKIEEVIAVRCQCTNYL